MEMIHQELPDAFPALSRKVMDLLGRTREALFNLDAPLSLRLVAECSSLTAEARKAEGACSSSLLVGITSPEERFELMRSAQRCSRLGRIVYQVQQIAQNIADINGQISTDEIAAFKPIFLLAEVELKDAVLSILQEDEHLAYSVRKKDEELDALYAEEIQRIFHNTSNAMFYNFQTGIGLLFILRAIERIGDHAKQMAIPSFYLLNPASTPKKSAIPV